MPTGTKFAAIAIVVLLGAAGLYFAFLSPSKPPKQSGSTATNSSAFSGSGANPATAIPSGARTTPETLTLTPNNGLAGGTTPTTTPSTTPAFGTNPVPSTTTGAAVARNDQPTFAPGASGSTTGGGKGDGTAGALAPGGLSGTGSTTTRPNANPLATNSTGMNGFAPSSSSATSAATSGATTGTGTTTPGTSVASRSGPTPAGSPAATVPQLGSTAPASGSTSEQTYVVKKGDSLSTIAQQFYGSAKDWKRIANANPLVDPNSMKVGAKLRIPAKADGGTTAVASAETTKPTTTAGTAGGSSGGSQSHTVASGDTLSSISTKYYGSGKHWNKIYASNKSLIGTDPGNLKVGQKLTIPSRTTVVGAETVER
jgi:nucleoid-associated protein YgaU